MTRFYYITALALVFSFGGEVQAISFPNDARYSAKPRIERIDLLQSRPMDSVIFSVPRIGANLDIAVAGHNAGFSDANKVESGLSFVVPVDLARRSQLSPIKWTFQLDRPKERIGAAQSLLTLNVEILKASPRIINYRAPEDASKAFFDAAGRRRAAATEAPTEIEFSSEELSAMQAYDQVTPSTVFITYLTKTGGDRDIHMEPEMEQRHSSFKINGYGSGFVWDRHGHIVTNCHVVHKRDADVRGEDVLWVRLHDGTEWGAKAVGQDPFSDIAVLKVAAPFDKLDPVHLGDSGRLRVGQTVFAIGSPLGLVGTLTRGIVSALNREIRGMAGVPIRGLIQTDASVHPGNSGCPLLDRAGRLIGMVTMTYIGKEGSAGPSFAIPINSIKKIVSPVIENSGQIIP